MPSQPVETSSTQSALMSPSQGKPTLHPVTQTRPSASPPLSPSLCWVCLLLHSSWSLPLLPADSSPLCLGDRSSPQPPSHWALARHRSTLHTSSMESIPNADASLPIQTLQSCQPTAAKPGLQLPDCAQGFIHAFSPSLLSPLSGMRGPHSRKTFCPLRLSRAAPPTRSPLSSTRYPEFQAFPLPSLSHRGRDADFHLHLPPELHTVPGTQTLHQYQQMTDGFKEHPTGFILRQSTENIRVCKCRRGNESSEQREKNHGKFKTTFTQQRILCVTT